jgi:hypothetical protein
VHRHGRCALILLQHAAVGAAFPMMAPAHGVSCVASHVAASAVLAHSSRTAAVAANINCAGFFMASVPTKIGSVCYEEMIDRAYLDAGASVW